MKSVYPRCPACNGDRHSTVVAADGAAQQRFLSFSRAKYGGLMDGWLDEIDLHVLRCAGCGHHWYRDQPSPDQLLQMYESAVPLSGSATVSREPSAAVHQEMRKLYRMVARSISSPTLLDYGSGYGRWARAAAAAGFTVTAYEPSRSRGAEQVHAFELVHDLEALEERRFDVVNLEQVLEHVPEPVSVLRDLRSLCGDASLLRVSVPNISRPPEGPNVWAQWPYNGRAPHIMAPFEHVHGFTQRSLMATVQSAGYRPLPISRLWREYSLYALRRLLGASLLPRVGVTMMLARVGPLPTHVDRQ